MPNSKTTLCSQQQCLSNAIEWTWLSTLATGIATLSVPYTDHEMLDIHHKLLAMIMIMIMIMITENTVTN